MQHKDARENQGLKAIHKVCLAPCKPSGRAPTAHSHAGAFGCDQLCHLVVQRFCYFCYIVICHSSPSLSYSQHCPSPHVLKQIAIFMPGLHWRMKKSSLPFLSMQKNKMCLQRCLIQEPHIPPSKGEFSSRREASMKVSILKTHLTVRRVRK